MKVTRRIALLFFGLSIFFLAGDFPLWGEEDHLAKFGINRLDKKVDAPEFTLLDLKRSSLEKIHQDYRSKGLVILAISIDRGSGEEVRKLVQDYVNKHNLTFLNLLDPKTELADQYGVRGIPANLFINAQGKVVAAASGYRQWTSEEGRKVIEQLLSETN